MWKWYTVSRFCGMHTRRRPPHMYVTSTIFCVADSTLQIDKIMPQLRPIVNNWQSQGHSRIALQPRQLFLRRWQTLDRSASSEGWPIHLDTWGSWEVIWCALPVCFLAINFRNWHDNSGRCFGIPCRRDTSFASSSFFWTNPEKGSAGPGPVQLDLWDRHANSHSALSNCTAMGTRRVCKDWGQDS